MNSNDRRYEGPLPFGRTSITASEARELVDLEGAYECAREGSVIEPHRVEQFVESYPELFDWLEQNGRDYPWRNTSDPWEVYTAEILLQRTRGDAVEEVYPEFLDRFPDPASLHAAPEEQIRETVYSLGFVNHRVRSLTEAAEIFCSEYSGTVPDDLEELKRPWRVGDYSARACQIFSRGDTLALVDTNFARVISRVLGYEMPPQPHKSEEVYKLMQTLIPDDPALARSFNLAILDLGALICTSSSPECSVCPINHCCNYFHRIYRG
ncbi:hypothetical protein [Haloarchaeobius sp. DYHT-AS-18]|uniref:hypothetical protein n=1 Tax=Haloarchaeobius sp. DYHT-AS-18 TaxID=3446117 RepID=UPI003EBD7621